MVRWSLLDGHMEREIRAPLAGGGASAAVLAARTQTAALRSTAGLTHIKRGTFFSPLARAPGRRPVSLRPNGRRFQRAASPPYLAATWHQEPTCMEGRPPLMSDRASATTASCPDGHYPQMWRVRRPDGSLSDMATRSRAKDAARSLFDRDLKAPQTPTQAASAA
jgi:hypothetical protein